MRRAWVLLLLGVLQGLLQGATSQAEEGACVAEEGPGVVPARLANLVRYAQSVKHAAAAEGARAPPVPAGLEREAAYDVVGCRGGSAGSRPVCPVDPRARESTSPPARPNLVGFRFPGTGLDRIGPAQSSRRHFKTQISLLPWVCFRGGGLPN